MKSPEELITTLVLSPAGSGKTERLARRYIALLKAGVEPERILTITFTDKAAAEMKERIFRILKKEDPELEKKLKDKILKLRISTIDSFCFSLLKTFYFFLRLPPDLEVSTETEILWNLSSYDTLMRIAGEQNSPDYHLLLELISDKGFRGWTVLYDLFTKLFRERLSCLRVKEWGVDEELIKSLMPSNPSVYASILGEDYLNCFPKNNTAEEIERAFLTLEKSKGKFLTTKGEKRKIKGQGDLDDLLAGLKEYYYHLAKVYYTEYFKKVFSLFTRRFLADYSSKKYEKGVVDFHDLEFHTYRLLTEFEGWENILYLFDAHTDHILVDEFQDTSFLQWAIIDKLSEEWRSGWGAKRAKNIEPTLFLVGDDKQSIYLFRNAQSEIFLRAKDKLEGFLKDRFRFETVRDNYRSLSSIIDFTNYFFSQLFTGDQNQPPFITRYSEFAGKRKNPAPGKVEIIVSPGTDRIEERRKLEAKIICQRIKSLLGEEIVFDQEERPLKARYEHFALLLRRRTHLAIYEKAFLAADIPYLVVKGIGFYEEPEIQILLALINFFAEPTDDFSLYCLLKSLFGLAEGEIFLIASQPGESLWNKVLRYRKDVAEKISLYLNKVNKVPTSLIIEEVLTQEGGWRIFAAHQRYYNIKKFIRIIENLEWAGKGLLEIKDYFERAKENKDEPKADVFTEGIDAVRIMTIHAAKGLEFPIVFCAGLDEELIPIKKTNDFILEEKDEATVSLIYLPDKNLQRTEKSFQEMAIKMIEEEKRVFYVACTRARDYLILSGIFPNKLKSSRLRWLSEILKIELKDDKVFSPINLPGVEFLSGKDCADLWEEKIKKETAKIEKEEKISPVPKYLLGDLKEEEKILQPVTKETNEDLRRHGEGAIIFGEVMHKILERIARGELPGQLEAILKEAARLFRLMGIPRDEIKTYQKEVLQHWENMTKKELAEIILPQSNSFAELPFIYSSDNIIYQGRIDRVIIKGDEVLVYDYKTYPINEEEIPFLLDFYHQSQMAIYLKAVSEIFPGKKVKGYLIFTAHGAIYPLG